MIDRDTWGRVARSALFAFLKLTPEGEQTVENMTETIGAWLHAAYLAGVNGVETRRGMVKLVDVMIQTRNATSSKA